MSQKKANRVTKTARNEQKWLLQPYLCIVWDSVFVKQNQAAILPCQGQPRQQQEGKNIARDFQLEYFSGKPVFRDIMLKVSTRSNSCSEILPGAKHKHQQLLPTSHRREETALTTMPFSASVVDIQGAVAFDSEWRMQ